MAKSKVVVWFNHWFSTVYHLINLIKDQDYFDLYIIGSNKNPLSAYESACDEWFQEPSDLSGDAYAEYCLKVCKEKGVDVFIPKRGLIDIAKNLSKFTNAGIKVFLEKNYDVCALLDDKIATYEEIKKFLPEIVPEYVNATDIETFKNGYQELSKKYERCCYKLSKDEGALSFKVIDDSLTSISHIYEKPGNKISFEDSIKLLSSYSFRVPFLLMPFLSGDEISVDCLKTSKGIIVIPRTKYKKRFTRIDLDEKLIQLCETIVNHFNFEMPINVQFKQDNNGKLYLLEINTRMSGGLQLSAKGTGINIPRIAFLKLFDIEDEWHQPNEDIMNVANVESPIKLANVFDYDNTFLIGKRLHTEKRSFLFVNKYQAKHIPSNPSLSLDMMHQLANKISKKVSDNAPLIIGFAETATAISNVIAKAFPHSFYIQTTREDYDNFSFLDFSEEHSHAVEQRLYTNNLDAAIKKVKTIIIIDDELTTGKTIYNLIKKLKETYQLKDIHYVVGAILNRIDYTTSLLSNIENISFVELIRSEEKDFSFLDGLNTNAPIALEKPVEEISYQKITIESKGNPRFGCFLTDDNWLKEIVSQIKKDLSEKKVCVLGSEEFMYKPLLLGDYLMNQYHTTIRCHATTRSPISVLDEDNYPIRNGYVLSSVYEKERTTYIYNVDAYDYLIFFTDANKMDESNLNALLNVFKKHGTKKFIVIEEKQDV